MYKKLSLAVVIVLSLTLIVSGVCGLAQDSDEKVETIKITAWTVGPDNPAFYREENLKSAVDRLNRMYEVAGINKRVKLNSIFWTQKKTAYWQKVLLAFQSGDAPDILVNGHEKIGRYVENDYLLPLDKYYEKYDDLLGDLYQGLIDAGKYKGHIYGVPQDTEARMMYFRTDVLKQMGYSEEGIEELKQKANSGEFTLTDMAKLGKEAQEKGLVEWGLWHRPSAGTDWLQWYISFGGKLQDPETGKLIFDRTAYKPEFKFYHDLIFKWEITPPNMYNYEWSSIHKGWIEGQTLFYQGGSYQFAEWKVDYNWEKAGEKIDFFLQPKGNEDGIANTISHPLMYMVNKRAEHPDIAFELLALASASDLNLLHAINSGHLAIRKGEAELSPYANDAHLRKSTELLSETHTVPNHQDWPKYQDIIYEAIKGVESGSMGVDQALDWAVRRLKREIGEENLIIVG